MHLVLLAWLGVAPALEPGSDARVLVAGALLPEASPPHGPEVIATARDQPIAVDLGRQLRIAAILLQADGDDVYFVEGATLPGQWRILWRVPRVVPAPGLRTRTVVLDAPAEARYLRVRPTQGHEPFAVARLRVHDSVPRPWPPPLDYSRPGSRLPPLPWVTPARVGPLRDALGTLGLLLVGWSLLARPRQSWIDRARRACLGAVALLVLLGWWNFLSFRFPVYAHWWEAFHYYVGAKYFPELGYDGLYECVALADAEAGLQAQVRERRIRDLRTNRITLADDALARPERCRGRFTPERWAAFGSDVAVFRRELGPEAWERAQMDHGYNATPAWTLLGRPLATLVPASGTGITALAAIDGVLILLGFWLVARSFGLEAACVAALYFGLNAFSRYAWTGGAFLRYDWLFLAVAGVCALKSGRPLLAGFALAYSALLRLFPAALLAGLGLALAARIAAARSLLPAREWKRLAAGVLLATGTLLPASLAVAGPGAWTGLAVNTRKYLGTAAENLLGLPTILAYRTSLRQELTMDPLRPDTHADWVSGQAEASRATRPLALAVGLSFLALLFAAAGRSEPWAAAVLGVGLLPMALKMANYYYVLLVLYALLWASSPATGFGLVVLAWLSNPIAELWPASDERSVWASLAICGFVVFATLVAARGGWARRRGAVPGELGPAPGA